MGSKPRAAPGLPDKVRENLPTYVQLLLDNLGEEDLAEGNFEAANDEDDDDVSYGFAVGYINCCADICGVAFNEFVEQIAVEAELIEKGDGDG
jgi:hypothetical protein